MGELWFFVVAIGPLLLLLAIYWAWLRNRKADSPRQIERSEAGARQLREEIKRDPDDREE